MRKLAILASLLLATGAFAQTAIGNYTLTTNASLPNFPEPGTIVDVGSGASQAGTIGAVAIRFNGNGCTGNAFKVKFFRPAANDLVLIAERGPFAVTGSITVVAIAPAVAVQQGDLLGVAELRNCAEVAAQSPVAGRGAVFFEGDVGNVSLTDSLALPNVAFSMYAAESTSSEVRTQIVLAAGAAPGSGGAQFRTDVFLGNLRQNRAAGRLVYHPAGTSGVPTDPAVPFSVESARSLTLPNFVGAFLGITGVGSIDVYTAIGFEVPTVSVRIYDDAGAAGTKGFTLEALPPEAALQPFENAILFAPSDTTRFRMNIGVRTLEATEVQFLHLDAGGNQRAFVTRNYPANYFIQGAAADFTGVAPQSGDQIVVYTQQKPVFAYGSIIDNAANDPSVQVAKHLK